MMPADPDRDDTSRSPGRRDPLQPSTGLTGISREADTDKASGPDAAVAEVIHDLINMLTVVVGSLEQLRRQSLDRRGQQQLDWAEWAAGQAGRLTQQMLTPAHGETARAGIVDLNGAISAFATTLGQSAGKSVVLAVDLVPGPLPVRLDGVILELVLLSLVRTAADTTVGGGQVTIRTAGYHAPGFGGRAAIEVTVSGTGVSPEAVQCATDALLTTKRPERGAGLGLRMVQRFAADAGGMVEIETNAGRDMIFRLVLPRCETE